MGRPKSNTNRAWEIEKSPVTTAELLVEPAWPSVLRQWDTTISNYYESPFALVPSDAGGAIKVPVASIIAGQIVAGSRGAGQGHGILLWHSHRTRSNIIILARHRCTKSLQRPPGVQTRDGRMLDNQRLVRPTRHRCVLSGVVCLEVPVLKHKPGDGRIADGHTVLPWPLRS